LVLDLKYNCIKGTWISYNKAIVDGKEIYVYPCGYCLNQINLKKDYFFNVEPDGEGFIIKEFIQIN
jgi:hypothetical protein